MFFLFSLCTYILILSCKNQNTHSHSYHHMMRRWRQCDVMRYLIWSLFSLDFIELERVRNRTVSRLEFLSLPLFESFFEPRTVPLPTLVVRSTSVIVNYSLPGSRKVREGIQFTILTLFSSLLHFVNEDLLNVMSWTRCSRLWTSFLLMSTYFFSENELWHFWGFLLYGVLLDHLRTKNNEMFTSNFFLRSLYWKDPVVLYAVNIIFRKRRISR